VTQDRLKAAGHSRDSLVIRGEALRLFREVATGVWCRRLRIVLMEDLPAALVCICQVIRHAHQ
jgi:hypothetical protein